MADVLADVRQEVNAIRIAWQANGDQEADCAALIDRIAVMSKCLERLAKHPEKVEASKSLLQDMKDILQSLAAWIRSFPGTPSLFCACFRASPHYVGSPKYFKDLAFHGDRLCHAQSHLASSVLLSSYKGGEENDGHIKEELVGLQRICESKDDVETVQQMIAAVHEQEIVAMNRARRSIRSLDMALSLSAARSAHASAHGTSPASAADSTVESLASSGFETPRTVDDDDEETHGMAGTSLLDTPTTPTRMPLSEPDGEQPLLPPLTEPSAIQVH